MNEKTEQLSLAPSLTILVTASAKLRSAWENCTVLSGHYWRLYYHDAPGAGVFLDGKRFEFLPNKIYLLPPLCELKTWTSGDPKQIYIHFEVSGVLGTPDHLCTGIPLTEELSAQLRTLDFLLDKTEPALRRELMFASFRLASEALTKLPQETFCEPDHDARIARVRNHIHNAPGCNFTIDSLAHEAGMAPNSFLLRFREITGMTPYQYLLSIRYTTAARLLKEGEFDIDQICERIGVNDRFHFSRKFKSLYGVSPGAYRGRKKSLSKPDGHANS